MMRLFFKNILFSLVFLITLNGCHTFGGGAMTRNEVQRMTPADAFKRLTEGYDRFQKDRLKNYRLDAQRYSTGRNGAFPPAVVLCSADSRVAPELIYNQGLGDIYTLRAPATIITQESLAGMEHACRDLGSKVIVVLCQTNDDFVAAAIDNNQSGNYPAVNAHFRDLITNIKRDPNWKRWRREEFMNIVTREHLMLNLERVRNLSPILRGMLERGEIMLVGGVYNIETGKIGYLNSTDADR